ncbi:MAG: hypothetical protein LAN84_04575 [Acidobacteriia bacterium]|nr:hypothetical protein [Terriglobia bacterium]
MESESPLKKVGSFGLAVVIIVAVFLLTALFLRGMVWASEKALPWLIDAGRIAFDVCALGLLPLCIFRRTRPWAGSGFYLSSFVFGAVLFAFSCLVVVQIWGYGGLIFGLVLGGVGVVPVAFLATLLHRAWPLFWDVVLGTVLTFGTRFLGIYLSTPKQLEEQEEEVPV